VSKQANVVVASMTHAGAGAVAALHVVGCRAAPTRPGTDGPAVFWMRRSAARAPAPNRPPTGAPGHRLPAARPRLVPQRRGRDVSGGKVYGALDTVVNVGGMDKAGVAYYVVRPITTPGGTLKCPTIRTLTGQFFGGNPRSARTIATAAFAAPTSRLNVASNCETEKAFCEPTLRKSPTSTPAVAITARTSMAVCPVNAIRARALSTCSIASATGAEAAATSAWVELSVIFVLYADSAELAGATAAR